MREHNRESERGEEGVHEQAAADAGDGQEAVVPAAAQRVPHDEQRVRAGQHRHERRDDREGEDLRVDYVHAAAPDSDISMPRFAWTARS